ncbi:hypothetical protein WMY93_031828 [Mugilogobius chulae]|uniref:Uncharacterized protein n=1 Tax=Mugilogobius chulae TaxID=88201 RepID=A0AAW0MLV2_9GOBI
MCEEKGERGGRDRERKRDREIGKRGEGGRERKREEKRGEREKEERKGRGRMQERRRNLKKLSENPDFILRIISNHWHRVSRVWKFANDWNFSESTQDHAPTRKSLNQDRTRSEPGPNQDRTRSEPGPNQDRTRSEPGPNQDRTRSEPGPNQKKRILRLARVVGFVGCLALEVSSTRRKPPSVLLSVGKEVPNLTQDQGPVEFQPQDQKFPTAMTPEMTPVVTPPMTPPMTLVNRTNTKLTPARRSTEIKGEYPEDVFSLEKRRQGWILLHFHGMLYIRGSQTFYPKVRN